MIDFCQKTWKTWKWVIISILAMISLALGLLGYLNAVRVNNYPTSYANIVYWALRLFTFEMDYIPEQSNWMLEVSRFTSPMVFFYTLWHAIAIVLKENLERVKTSFINNHVIICGLGEKGLLLVRDFRNKGFRVLVMDTDENNANIEQCRNMGALVMLGNANDKETLRRARIDKAQYVFAVCGKDGVNTQVAVYADEFCQHRKGNPLTCYVHVADPDLYDLLKEQEIMFGKSSLFRLEYFNIYRDGARVLLARHSFHDIESIHPRVLIVGLGQLGESILLQAAKAWYWERGIVSEKREFTIVDEKASDRVDLLKNKYPNLADACNIRAIDIDTNSLSFFETDFSEVDRTYVCLEDDASCLSAGLSLIHKVACRRIPVVVCVGHENGLGTLLSAVNDGVNSLQALQAFGLFNSVFNADLIKDATHERLAQAIHQQYIEQQKAAGVVENSSMKPWDELDESLKEANRRQADDYRFKLERINCGIRVLTRWTSEGMNIGDDLVEKLAEKEHIRWCEERQKDGWRYAPGEKNTTEKTNPCLVSWELLSEEEKNKDRSAVRNIPIILARFGYEVYRV